MKKYVVIDTNVLVSALITRNENAPTLKILKYFSQNKIVPVYSSEIVKEHFKVKLIKAGKKNVRQRNLL